MSANSTLLSIALLSLCGGSVATCYGQKSEPLSDEKLMELIKKAAKDRVRPEKIEQLVGSKAIVNTSRDKDWLFLELVRYEFEGERLRLYEMKEVVYWRRPVKATPSKLVGIAWTKDNEPVFFLAEGRPR